MKLLKTHPFLNQIGLLLIIVLLISSCKSDKQEQENAPINKTQTSIDLTTMKSQVYLTAHNSDLKLTLTDTLNFLKFKQPLETDASIIVDASKTFQSLLGIGAALTDASAETFYKLTEENQTRFLEAYYSVDKGIGYSLARTIIHSCDFSTESYTYIEEGDSELATFNIERDRKFRIPFTKKYIGFIIYSLYCFNSCFYSKRKEI